MFGLCKIGNDKIFGSWKNFEKEYIRYQKNNYGVDVFYKNLDKLKDKTELLSLRRTDKEIDIQMPKIIEQNIMLPMNREQQQIDEAIKQDSMDLMDKLSSLQSIKDINKRNEARFQIEGALQGLLALRVGASDCPELFKLSNSPAVQKKYGSMVKQNKSGKLDYLKEHVQELISAGHKIVIFSKFETMVRILERELSKITDVVTFTGKLNAKQKEASRIAFKTQSNVGCIVMSNAGAEGLNLAEARYLINYDLDWDIGINDQRNKRIRRLDSTFDRVFVYNYISIGSADELVVEANKRKQTMFDYLINNTDAKSNQMKDIMNKF